MKSIVLCLLFVLFLCKTTFSSYKNYSKEIQLSEELIIDNKLNEALDNYLIIFKKYNYPYIKEILQATYIACYVGDVDVFTSLIEIGIKKGLSEYEYLTLKNFWNSMNEEEIDNQLFDKNRLTYIQKLNKEKMVEFAKLDFIFASIQPKINKSITYQKQYTFEMQLLRSKYLELIQLYGYTNSEETGRQIESLLVKKEKKTKLYDFYIALQPDTLPFYLDKKIVKFNTYPKYIVPSMLDVGSRFLTHYIHPVNINYLDTILFQTIEIGVNQLILNPYLMISMLESTRLLENDFALTNYSQVLLKIQMNEFSKYDLDKTSNNQININRDKYGIRSLEQEEKLLRSLYKLKTNKELKHQFSNSELTCISFEKRIFLSILS